MPVTSSKRATIQSDRSTTRAMNNDHLYDVEAGTRHFVEVEHNG